jgi:hypothetical protein
MAEIKPKSFIHFGCWNKDGCKEDNPTNLTKMVNTLKQIISDDKPEFLSICGDNYYPKKEKFNNTKKKTFVEKDLFSGLDCLPKDIKIFMTYGNHDFETNLFIDDVQETDCTLTMKELEIIQSFPNISLQLNQFSNFGDKTKILFLETTVWDQDDIIEYIQCYKIIDPRYQVNVDDPEDVNRIIELVKKDQVDLIQTFVDDVNANQDITNVIIVGHHPIALFKEKKDKIGFSMLNESFNELLYNNIFKQCNPSLNYYYLCADLHHYQPGDIVVNDMHIKQYIVGTGGAELDNINITKFIKKGNEPEIPEKVNYTIENFNYTINPREIIVEYGFLKCIEEDGLSFTFIPIQNSGGKKRRTRRRGSKKQKRKSKRKKRRR